MSIFNLKKNLETSKSVWLEGDGLGCVLVQKIVGDLIKFSGGQRLAGLTCSARSLDFIRLRAVGLSNSIK